MYEVFSKYCKVQNVLQCSKWALGLEERGWELGLESRAGNPERQENYRVRRSGPGYKCKGARAQTLGLRACW